MTHGATFLKGNYDLPSRGEPVKLSRERWEMLCAASSIGSLVPQIKLMSCVERDGVIFLPAEYVPRTGADVLAESRADCNARLAALRA